MSLRVSLCCLSTCGDMNIHAYVKNVFENCPYAPLHRCHSCHTVATFMCPKQRHRQRHKSLAYADPQLGHSTRLMPTEFTLIIAEYGIRNREYGIGHTQFGIGYTDAKTTDFVATVLSLRSLTFTCHPVTLSPCHQCRTMEN